MNMNNEIAFELLFDRIKTLESNVEELQREVRILRRQLRETPYVNERLNKSQQELLALARYLDSANINGEGPFKVSADDIRENTEIDISDCNDFMRRFKIRLLHRYNYAIMGFWTDSSTGTLMFEFEKIQKIGIREIKDYIKNKIESGTEEYIELNALDIHKELKLVSRMPTVCKAMERLMDEDTDSIVGEGKLSSTYTVRYKTGKRDW